MIAPVVAVGAIAFDEDGRVLLIQRGRAPGAGLWTVPGGRIEPGETAAAACAREVAEETGLEVEVVALAEVVERIGRAPDGALTHHFVILDHLVRVRGGELRAGDDAAAVGWFGGGELERLPLTDGLLPVLERARALASRGGAG
ncbi:MAG TPA: NUDIX domain-containing protein [Kofleriaceae bacterium]|nr:NUDIX domain-containing protein [Kofleriaceae bacterium]